MAGAGRHDDPVAFVELDRDEAEAARIEVAGAPQESVDVYWHTLGRVDLKADRKAGALGSVEDLSGSRALNHRFEVNGGLLAEESSVLLRAFFEARR